MSQYANLKAAIAANVYENHNNQVTANMVKAAMNAMVDSLGAGYQYLGIATPTNPGTAQTPDQKVFYIATTPGTYTYLDGLVVNDGEVAVLKWDTAWHKEVTGAATAAQVTELGQKVSIVRNGVVVKTTDTYGNVLASISTSGLVNTITFNEFIITGNIETAVSTYQFVQISSGSSYSLQNLDCLYINIKTKTISVTSLMTVAQLKTIEADENNVILLYNLWGRLYSPVATLESELYDYYKRDVINNLKYWITLGQNICVIKAGEPYAKVISSISKNNLSNTIKFNDFVTTGNVDTLVNNYHFVSFTPSSAGYTLGNLDCLYINLKTKTFATATISTVSQLSAITADQNNVILLLNMWGRLYSSIPTIECELYDYYNADTPAQKVTIVVAQDSSGDFTSVRDAVKSITDASKKKPYVVYVKNGTYDEIDIHTKDYVDIIGESRDGVILYTDGTSTENSPSDYTWGGGSYANIPINTIPKAWKHLFIHMSNSTIANMTMKVRMCKYVIHQDNEGQEYDAIVRNCVLIREENFSDNGSDTYNQGLQYIVGIGAKKGQYQRYYDCDFVLSTKDLPDSLFVGSIVWHNWNGTNGAKEAGATFKNCSCFGSKFIAEVTNLKGAGESDVLQFENVYTDIDNANLLKCLSNDYYDATAINRFPIAITSNNGILVGAGDGIVEQTINAFAMVKKYSTTAFSKGQPIAIDSVSVATEAPFGIALKDNSANEFIFIGKSNVFNGLAVADSYSFGDSIYISAGKFTKTANGDVVGKVIETKTLSGDGLLLIEKI